MNNTNIWLTNIQDLLTRHIYNGLRKTYADVHRITKGKRIAIAVQTAMEGIVTLSRVVLNEDYKIFLKSLQNSNKTEDDFNELIKNVYYSYAVEALKSAGLKCNNLDVSILGTNLVLGVDFVHSVYINAARGIWINPFMLIQNNVNELYRSIHSAIEKSVRDSIDLNSIIGAYKNAPPTVQAPVRSKPQTIREHFNQMNHNKTILDSESESEDEDHDLIAQVAGSNSSSSLSDNDDNLDNVSKIPEQPALDDEITIDDNENAPDNETFREDEESSDDEPPMIINIPRRNSYGALLKSANPSEQERIREQQKEDDEKTLHEEQEEEEQEETEEQEEDETEDSSVKTSKSTQVEVNLELLSEKDDDTETVIRPRLNANQSNNASIRAVVDDTMENMNLEEQAGGTLEDNEEELSVMTVNEETTEETNEDNEEELSVMTVNEETTEETNDVEETETNEEVNVEETETNVEETETNEETNVEETETNAEANDVEETPVLEETTNNENQTVYKLSLDETEDDDDLESLIRQVNEQKTTAASEIEEIELESPPQSDQENDDNDDMVSLMSEAESLASRISILDED